MLPSTRSRVTSRTSDKINRRIELETVDSIRRTISEGRAAINRRLEELDQEWDIERTIETEGASMALIGLGLGFAVDRKFFALPAVVASMLLLHSTHGWYPLLPLFRRMGIRTAEEINAERFALKAARGDFAVMQDEPNADVVLAAARA